MLRAVVVGCGGIGSRYDEERLGPDAEAFSHAGAYDICADVVLAGGVDPDPVRRRGFEARWGKPTWSSIDEMLADLSPEVWSLCTPPALRLETADAAVLAGARGVLCEKPVAAAIADGVRLWRLFERARIPVVVNYSRRFDRLHREFARRVAAGELGRIQRIDIHYVRGIQNYGTHAFDFLRFLTGADLEWVAAAEGVDLDALDPSPTVIGALQNGTQLTLLPLARAHFDLFEVDVWGTGGRCRVDQFARDVSWYAPGVDDKWHEQVLAPVSTGFRTVPGGAMSAAVTELVSAIRGGRVTSSVMDGLHALVAVAAVQQSAEHGGCRVNVPELLSRELSGQEGSL